MNAIRWPVAPACLAAALVPALAFGAAGCSLLHLRARDHKEVTITLGGCAPSALASILDRGPATLVWPEFRALVTGTARCGERLFVIDAGSGRQLGSFVAPAGPHMRVPAPPSPVPAGATSFLRAKHSQALAAYQALIRQDLTRLRTREREMLASWAARVLAKVADGRGVGLDPGGRSLVPALSSALADIASLEQSGVDLGNRKVLAVLGLAGLRTSVPQLPASLKGASVVVTGFPPSPDLRRAWRSGLRWEGAATVTLLTRAAIGELAHDGARGLAGR
jgi:hypothetical protein